MRSAQQWGLMCLVAAGLMGCGPIDEVTEDGFKVQVSLESETAFEAVVDVDYAVVDEFETAMSEGNVMTGATVYAGVPYVVGNAFEATPGHRIILDVRLSIDGQSFDSNQVSVVMEEGALGLDLQLKHYAERDEWFLFSSWIEAPQE